MYTDPGLEYLRYYGQEIKRDKVHTMSISSAESQKGAIADQRCSIENQKGAIANDFVQQ